MANRSPRQVQFNDKDLSQLAPKVNTQLASVERNSGSVERENARSLDILSDKIGRLADDAMGVEAAREGKLAAAAGTFAPTNGTSIRDQYFDKAGGELYFSKLSAKFEADAQTVFEKHKADPAGFQSAYKELQDKYRADDVFPEYHAAFDARATRLNTSFRDAALKGFQAKEKDQRLASYMGDMRASDTARTRLLATDPNAAGIEQNVEEMAQSQILRIRTLKDAGDISAVQAEALEAQARNEARVSVVVARAGKLASAEEVDSLRTGLRKQFTDGKFKVDGTAFEALDADLAKISKAKRVAFDAQSGVLDKAINDYLERHEKGLQPSVSEMAALTAEAEKLGPAGRQKIEEARQKLQMRQILASVPPERGEALIREWKREGARASANASPQEASDIATLRRLGWSPAAAAALIGNVGGESAGNTAARNPGDGRDGSDSIGLSQWNAERAAALKAFASARGKDWTDRETQLAFMDHELRTSERATGEALMRAKTPEEAARAAIGYFRPAGWTASTPEAGHNFAGRLKNTQRLSGAGLSAYSAGLIEDAEGFLKKRRTAMEKDPLGDAERNGVIPAIAPVEWQGPQLKDQVGARIVQAEAVARANNRAPVYLREDERDALRDATTKAGDGALGIVRNLVEGAGSRAPAILKEIDSAAPRLGLVGAMLSRGTPEQEAAAKDAFRALRMLQEPGAKTAPQPKFADVAEREELGRAFGGNIEARQKVIDGARLIYQGRIARGEIEPDGDKADKLYRQALRLAAGQSGEGANAVGGVADYTPPANWSGSARLIVPDGVVAKRFPDVIGAMKDIDLQDAPGGPPVDREGNRYDPAAFKRAYPVMVGGKLRFDLNPPGSPRSLFIGRADGQPFELDWQWYSTRVRPRVPQAFR